MSSAGRYISKPSGPVMYQGPDERGTSTSCPLSRLKANNSRRSEAGTAETGGFFLTGGWKWLQARLAAARGVSCGIRKPGGPFSGHVLTPKPRVAGVVRRPRVKGEVDVLSGEPHLRHATRSECERCVRCRVIRQVPALGVLRPNCGKGITPVQRTLTGQKPQLDSQRPASGVTFLAWSAAF